MTTTTHYAERERLMDRFRAARSTEERALVARQLRPLDDARLDTAERCDCSDASCQACVDRLDSAATLDLRPASKWLSPERIRALREQDPTERALMVATLEAVFRAAGKDDELTMARLRAESLDEIRAAFAELSNPSPDDETERTDHMTDDQEARARAAMNRDAHLAHRMDAAGSAYDALERSRADYQRGRPSDSERLDADERPEAPTKAKQGTPVEELEQLIAISKRESIPLQELLQSLERVKEMRSSDDARTDALDESGARSRMQHDAAVAWTRAPALGADARVRDPVPTLRDGVLDVGSFGSSFGGA